MLAVGQDLRWVCSIQEIGGDFDSKLSTFRKLKLLYCLYNINTVLIVVGFVGCGI